MQMTKPTISVIIATFNSEKTLPLVFESLVKQTFSRTKIEILVIDGGSTDQTLKIARKNNAQIINNPRTEQNFGKFLGYLHAKGRYIMFLDSDEVLENKNSLKIRAEIFADHPETKMIIGSGYKNPPHYPFFNIYINEYGDPFSFFIYRLSKDADLFITEMRTRYPIKQETVDYVIFDLSETSYLPLVELTAGGCMLDAKFLKNKFFQIQEKVELLNHSFYLIHSQFPSLAITKSDAVIHYSTNTLSRYLNKISWRVKNNIYYVSTIGQTVFTGREKFQSGNLLNLKKYLFVPYSYSIIFPLIDSIYLSLTRKDKGYLLHLPLCIYTASLIIYHSLLKAIGIKPQLRSYGENRLIK
jgi:glycosyltransferase involved in cell wall biosynthesis